jgi:AraC-like DNA-binding protein
VGELVGTGRCSIPTNGRTWLPIRQPVVLEHWPVQDPVPIDRFTTIASWRGPYGTIEHDGRTIGGKVHEFRRLAELPKLTDARLELATAFDEADLWDRDLLTSSGWNVVEPSTVVGSPRSFRRYVQQSPAELSVAQGVYVHMRSGWFGDRSVRYLASGRPIVVQDTGFTATLPGDEGILAFDDLGGAALAMEAAAANWERHAKAARKLAEDHFEATLVLGKLCQQIGVSS